MSRYQHYFKLTAEEAADYVRERVSFFSTGAVLESLEIGDGNINYVYRVLEPSTGRSLILKQSDPQVRSTGENIGTHRSGLEASALKLQSGLAAGFVPEVYLYDSIMSCIAMEDLAGYENLRYTLNKHIILETLGEDITTFMAETLMRTCSLVMPPNQKRPLMQDFSNPHLCGITEQLVYTDPYTDHGKTNSLTEENRDFLEKALYQDTALHKEVARLKNQFLSNAQALLHGDLHTGSIFVKPGSTKVLDPEFACFGPIGYDVGNVIANLMFAWVNGWLTIEAPEEQKPYLQWLEATIADTLDLFLKKSRSILRSAVTDSVFSTPDYLEDYLSEITSDIASVAGLELNRRIIGFAKVKDITMIEPMAKRVLAERICVTAGKKCILKEDFAFKAGADYVRLLQQTAVSSL